jgi:hypothetical protein
VSEPLFEWSILQPHRFRTVFQPFIYRFLPFFPFFETVPPSSGTNAIAAACEAAEHASAPPPGQLPSSTTWSG